MKAQLIVDNEPANSYLRSVTLRLDELHNYADELLGYH